LIFSSLYRLLFQLIVSATPAVERKGVSGVGQRKGLGTKKEPVKTGKYQKGWVMTKQELF